MQLRGHFGYHQPRFGRPALALDLMEPFRALIVDSAVLTAVNTRMVTARDFVRAGGAVALTSGGRKAFFRAYEMRMDTLVTHPFHSLLGLIAARGDFNRNAPSAPSPI